MCFSWRKLSLNRPIVFGAINQAWIHISWCIIMEWKCCAHSASQKVHMLKQQISTSLWCVRPNDIITMNHSRKRNYTMFYLFNTHIAPLNTKAKVICAGVCVRVYTPLEEHVFNCLFAFAFSWMFWFFCWNPLLERSWSRCLSVAYDENYRLDVWLWHIASINQKRKYTQ